MAATIADLLTPGAALDLALGVVLVELGALAVYRLVRSRHLVPPDVYANLLAAAGLLSAAHAALVSAAWGLWALSLLVALAAHGAALRLRWRPPAAAWPVALRRIN